MIKQNSQNQRPSMPPEQSMLPLFEEELPTLPSKQINDDTAALLGLSRLEGVGFKTLRVLVEIMRGRLANIWSITSEQLQQYLRLAHSPDPVALASQIIRQAEQLQQWGYEQMVFLAKQQTALILRGSSAYPSRLRELPDPPAWLFVEGDVTLLHHPAIVAIVGTREPTLQGIEAARLVSRLIASEQCVILSGLAVGIDEIAHQTAVDFGVPTVAVLGHGIDVIFPKATAGLRQQIIARGGAVVSEYLPRDTYQRERFVQRNRIQAALSSAVGVVEGRGRSGTAHTVRFAEQLGRPLFGVYSYELTPTMPTHELLFELQQRRHPVFDIQHSFEQSQLSSYLAAQFPMRPFQEHQTYVSPVTGIMAEVERILKSYQISDADMDWLIHQIREHKSTHNEGTNDADKSRHLGRK